MVLMHVDVSTLTMCFDYRLLCFFFVTAPVPAARPLNGSGPGSNSAPAPSPSHSNHGSSISVLSLAISGALVIMFTRI